MYKKKSVNQYVQDNLDQSSYLYVFSVNAMSENTGGRLITFSFGYKEVYRLFVYHAIWLCPALGFKISQTADTIILILFLH